MTLLPKKTTPQKTTLDQSSTKSSDKGKSGESTAKKSSSITPAEFDPIYGKIIYWIKLLSISIIGGILFIWIVAIISGIQRQQRESTIKYSYTPPKTLKAQNTFFDKTNSEEKADRGIFVGTVSSNGGWVSYEMPFDGKVSVCFIGNYSPEIKGVTPQSIFFQNEEKSIGIVTKINACTTHPELILKKQRLNFSWRTPNPNGWGSWKQDKEVGLIREDWPNAKIYAIPE